jgi:uncharacterized protein (TIGR02453 family)
MHHFTPATFRFLRDLARNNSREWFHANKPRYDEHVKQPFLDLIAALDAPLAKVSTHFRADPRPVGGSLFRIQRDTRFSGDKTPYKTWAGARLFHERRRETAAPSFYIHVAPDDCFVGAGIWAPEPATLKRLRAFLHDNPAAWIAATRAPAFQRRYAFWGDSLKRNPPGVPDDHPLLEDLKRKHLAAGCALTEAEVMSNRLPTIVAGHLRTLAPMVDYLCAALDLEF